MGGTMFLVLLLSLISQSSAYITNNSRKFYLGIPANHLWYLSSTLLITVGSEADGNVFLNVPFLNISRDQTISRGAAYIHLDSQLQKTGSFQEPRGIYIESDVDITAFVSNHDPATTDTYMALPLQMMGTRYIIASYEPSPGESSEFLVVGIYNDTHINLTYPNGTTADKWLNYLDVFQESAAHDLSGTIVVANKPVSVVSGASCADVLGLGCDIIMTQLLPVGCLGSNYIVPSVFSGQEFDLRVLSIVNETSNIEIWHGTNHTIFNTNTQGFHVDVENLRTPATVVSSMPSLVTEYIKSHSFMSIIPSVDQYHFQYSFVIPYLYQNFSNYIVVVIPEVYRDGLLVDGRRPTALNSSYAVPEPFTNYTMLVYDINTGHHYVNHTYNANFLVLSFGIDHAAKYGFVVGMKLQVSETGDGIFDGDRSICFSCKDMYHASLCERVKTCNNEEVCYLESTIYDGVRTFSSGCVLLKLCPLPGNAVTNETGDCIECCEGNFCNNKGCGDAGLTVRENRGPVCFACDHVESPNECSSVNLCRKDQVCEIHELEWGDYTHFQMGCTASPCLSSREPVDEIVGRSAPLCRQCCDEDFCNRDCTVGSSPNILG